MKRIPALAAFTMSLVFVGCGPGGQAPGSQRSTAERTEAGFPDFDCPHVSDRARDQLLGSDGVLRVGFNFGNPNNGTAAKTGVGPDLARQLGRCLDAADVVLTGYGSVPEMIAKYPAEWTIAYSRNTEQTPPAGFTLARAHIGVDNYYLARRDSGIAAFADVDQSGVTVGVAAGNSTAIYLSPPSPTALLHATVSPFPTVPKALEALRTGKVKVYAGSLSAEIAWQALNPNLADVIQPKFASFRLGAIYPLTDPPSDDGLCSLNDFTEAAKASFLQQSFDAAGLVGVSVPAAEPLCRSHGDEERRGTERSEAEHCDDP